MNNLSKIDILVAEYVALADKAEGLRKPNAILDARINLAVAEGNTELVEALQAERKPSQEWLAAYRERNAKAKELVNALGIDVDTLLAAARAAL